MKFHIISDSSCDLGREACRQLGVELVSFYAALGDETYYREERDVSTREFYQRMADRPGVFPKASMPTLEDYLEEYNAGRMDQIQLTEENQAFLALVDSVRESGLSNEDAYVQLLTGGTAGSETGEQG